MYDAHGYPSAFYMYPRSSISKTPFRLANNTGIIDSGYRGNLGAYFDCFSNSTEQIPKGSRLLQICAPDLNAFRVIIVNNLDNTSRGTGGFGSTGK
jgi:dUTP pyrophosphatase